MVNRYRVHIEPQFSVSVNRNMKELLCLKKMTTRLS